jgi:type IV pilus assembly protein PilA
MKKMLKNRLDQSAFSLIEIMVVIGILAIIATIAMPSQVGRITQQRLVETIELVEPFKAYIATYYRRNGGVFPIDNEAAGMPDAIKIKGNYLRKLEVRDGVLHLYLGQNLADKLHDRIVSIRPVYVKDEPAVPLSWVCGNNQLPSGMSSPGRNLTDLESMFLPGRCR